MRRVLITTVPVANSVLRENTIRKLERGRRMVLIVNFVIMGGRHKLELIHLLLVLLYAQSVVQIQYLILHMIVLQHANVRLDMKEMLQLVGLVQYVPWASIMIIQ